MLDLGVIIQAPAQDPNWIKKCLLMGLIALFVPIVGALNAMGWMRSYAEARIRGETELPEANFSYIGPGWRIFLMYLPIAGIMLLLYLVVGGLVAAGAALEIEALAIVGAILGMLLFLPVMLWITVFNPGMLYLHIVHGERWASLRFARQWGLAKLTGTEYLLLWVAFLICGFITQAGMLVCFVGLLVSIPYGYAMQAAAIAEYARITNKVG